MSRQRLVVRAAAVIVLGAPLLLGAAEWLSQSAAAEGKKQTPLATRSSPIAITTTTDYVWSVNPDNDSVSVFNVSERREHARSPRSGRAGSRGAWPSRPTTSKAYVTNMASGTVSVISTRTHGRSSTPSRWAPSRSAAR